MWAPLTVGSPTGLRQLLYGSPTAKKIGVLPWGANPHPTLRALRGRFRIRLLTAAFGRPVYGRVLRSRRRDA